MRCFLLPFFLSLLGCSSPGGESEVWTSDVGPWRTARVRSTYGAAGVDRTSKRSQKVPATMLHDLVLSTGDTEVLHRLESSSESDKDWGAVLARSWMGEFSDDGARLALSGDGGSSWSPVFLDLDELFWCPHTRFGGASDPWQGAPPLKKIMLEILGESTYTGKGKGPVHSTDQWYSEGKDSHANLAKARPFLGEFRAAVDWAETQTEDPEVRAAVATALGTPGAQLRKTRIAEVGSAMVRYPDFVEAINSKIGGPHRDLIIQALADAPGQGPDTVEVLGKIVSEQNWELLGPLTWSVAHRLEKGEVLPQAVAVLDRVARLDPNQGREVQYAIRVAVQGLYHTDASLDALVGLPCGFFKIGRDGSLTPSPNEVELRDWSPELLPMGKERTIPGYHSVGCLAAAARAQRR